MTVTECETLRVKLTVRTLYGIKVNKSILSSGDVTAAVAFTGSATDMEVSSSTLCSSSGRLMVASHPIRSVDCDDDSRMSASWIEDGESAAKETLPHVSLSMPVSQQLQPISLSISNRECSVSEELDDNSTSPSLQCGGLKPSVSCPYNSTLQSSESSWSNNKAPLPEIIELAIKIRATGEEESQDPHGKAFLVIFRHQKTGAFWIDLPVRVLKKSVDDCSSVGLAQDARLVVKVQLFKQTMKYETTKSTSSVEAGPSVKSNDVSTMSPAAVQAKISCLLDTIDKNEKEVMNFLRAQKRAMEVLVPVKTKATKEKSFQRTTLFGSTSRYWMPHIEHLFSNVDQCGVGDAVKSHFPDRDDDSVASTIATEDSLDF